MTLQMSAARKKLKELIVSCSFEEIFTDYLGWDACSDPVSSLHIDFAGEIIEFKMSPVAQKRGFVVCRVDCKTMPPQTVRNRLQRKFSLFHHEHLLIICDSQNNQKWFTEIDRENKSPLPVEYDFFAGKSPDELVEKLLGLGFSLKEEGGLTITDVVERASEVLMQNAERVTREFYDRFRKELKKFHEFINGLGDKVDKEQYAALMMNRLMFIYFIQRKGYLDDDSDYLRNRLKKMQIKFGKDQYYTGFYRHFLIRLFHSGLGAPENVRTEDVRELIGKVPYLNGGLFDEHEIEKEYGKEINIPDKAFEELFNFFDQYKWHLDDSSSATGRDINPDVIGYIFEKFINDRAKMGAYYTGEDITGYIARNTILPHLLQQAKENCAEAFHPEMGTIWRLLRQNPDAYIYASVRHGCNKPNSELSPDIEQGLDHDKPNLLKRRKSWNKAADPEWALLGETWREVIARRSRYSALYKKIKDGGITDIADLVTYNLDIEKLARNAISHHEGTDFLSAFFAAIAGRKTQENSNTKEQHGITVLDPACGSGAFLFAALKVLEPLYETCIDRMEEFVAENDALREKENTRKKKHEYFRSILDELSTHPNKKYWIYRSIILHNLFGVDIMPEAVEVAKLRFFLKLAAEAEPDGEKPNMGLEPLPDIDFNIRTGNALVGFSNMDEFEEIARTQTQLGLDSGIIKTVRTSAENVGNSYREFVNTQSILNIDTPKFRDAKDKLQNNMHDLNTNLNNYLALASPHPHLPFHWFSEFYRIMNHGGFDVVIGNPPYVKYREQNNTQGGITSNIGYVVLGYKTLPARNLYAFVMERGLSLLSAKGTFGMITPISITTSNNSQVLRDLFDGKKAWVSSFADRPSSLFIDAHQSLTITIAQNGVKTDIKSAGFLHWNKKERESLFTLLAYEISPSVGGAWGKLRHSIEHSILGKMLAKSDFLTKYFIPNGHLISVCGGTGGYFLRAFNEEQESSEYKNFYADKEKATAIAGIINSNTFYWLWRKFSNSRHLRLTDIGRFKVTLDEILIKKIKTPAQEAVNALTRTKEFREGDLSYFQYRPSFAKGYFDEVDKILAKHYDFTDEELDYIINYGYKYRMSGVAE